MKLPWFASWVLLLLITACDEPSPNQPVPLDTHEPETLAPDTAVPDTSALDTSAPDTAPEDTWPEPDTLQPDTGLPDVTPPLFCAADAACNALLLEDGSCPGACIPQRHGMHCPGVVRHGLCYDGVLPDVAERYNLPQGMWGAVDALPEEAVVGEQSDITLRLHNPSAADVTVNVRAWARQPVWTLVSTSFVNDAAVTVPAGGELALTVTLRAERASVFHIDNWFAVFINVESSQVGIRLPVGFGQTSEVACGARTFPASWCSGLNCQQRNEHYNVGRCCEAVFYPSAECCADADCAEGVCIDGQCISRVPDSIMAPSPLVGRQRILVVASDLGLALEPQLCDDSEAAFDELGLAEVDGWLRETFEARTGRSDALELEWDVWVVEDASVFVTDGDFKPNAFTEKLEAYLLAEGCLSEGITEDYDRFLLVSGRVDLGGPTGRAYDVGLACALSPWPRSLMTHELGHLYGALDLYLTSAGALQYRSALMSKADLDGRRDVLPSDAVFWGQVGLGDVEGSGVIDVFEFPQAPESIVLEEAVAELGADRLAVRADFDPPMARFEVELPDFGVRGLGFAGRAEVFGLDKTALEQAGQVRVRIRAAYHYTDETWTRQHLSLDEERVLVF